jgi:hypothetical protein
VALFAHGNCERGLSAVGASTSIFAVVAGIVVFSLLFVVALGRSAAQADENAERLRPEYMRELSRMYSTARLDRAASPVSYAGLGGLATHEKISREPSITIGR